MFVCRWRTWPITECSTHCGRGKQTMGFQCVQQFHDSNIGDKTVHNSSCANVHKPAEIVDCEGPCNSTHWEFGIWSQVRAMLFIYLFVTSSIIFGNMQNVIFSDIYSVFSSGTSMFGRLFSQSNIQTLYFAPTFI